MYGEDRTRLPAQGRCPGQKEMPSPQLTLDEGGPDDGHPRVIYHGAGLYPVLPSVKDDPVESLHRPPGSFFGVLFDRDYELERYGGGAGAFSLLSSGRLYTISPIRTISGARRYAFRGGSFAGSQGLDISTRYIHQG